MTSDLHDSFIALGLKPGTSWEEVKEKHKLLAVGLHPDKFKGEKKEKAETELKKVNHARDVLKKHFNQEHRETGCFCRTPDAGTEQTARQDDFEQRAAEARRRDTERAQGEADTKKASDAFNQATSAAAAGQQEHAQFAKDLEQSYEIGKESTKTALYCKLSVACLVWFLGNLAYANLSLNAYKMSDIHGSFNDEYWKLRKDFDARWDAYQKDKQAVLAKVTGKQPTLAFCESWAPPFDSNYERVLTAINDQPSTLTSPSASDYTGNTSTADELNRAITYYRGQMDKYKRKLDELKAMIDMGATGGNINLEYEQATESYRNFQKLHDEATVKLERNRSL